MMIVLTTWLLLAILIVYEIHQAFQYYQKDKSALKLSLHILLVYSLGGLVVYLGLIGINMPYDVTPVKTYAMLYDPAPAKAVVESRKTKKTRSAKSPAAAAVPTR